MNHSSFIQPGWLGNKILVNLLEACNASYYIDSSGEVVIVPFVQVDGEPTLGAPVNSLDRYIGNDYVGSYVTLDPILSPTCMHLAEWKISFYTQAILPPAFSKVYAESNPPTGTQYALGLDATGNLTKLRVVIRELTTTHLAAVSVLDVFDGVVRFVEVERTLSGDVTLKVDGVYELLDTGLVGTYAQATASSIGAIDTGTIGSDFAGKVWDVEKCGQLIPLNEGVGTDIKDSTGLSVGTLTDPNNEYWDYYLPRYMVPATGPLQCREDSITTTALGNKDFSGDWIICGEMTPYDVTAGFDVYFKYGRIASGGILVFTPSIGIVNFEIQDDLNIVRFNYSTNSIMDVKTHYEIEKIGTTVTIKFNGILVYTDATVDLTTNGFTVELVSFGASDITGSKANVDQYWAQVMSDNLNDYWDMTTRLPTLTDVDANKIIGTGDGTVLNIIDNSPFGIYYPYIGSYPDNYLVKDNPCGDNTIQIIDDIAQIIEGEWQFIP